jgi:hypothetical protein
MRQAHRDAMVVGPIAIERHAETKGQMPWMQRS